MDNDKTCLQKNALERCLWDCERTVIIHALRRTGGDAADAARILGTSKRILAGKIHKYEIDCTQFKQP